MLGDLFDPLTLVICGNGMADSARTCRNDKTPGWHLRWRNFQPAMRRNVRKVYQTALSVNTQYYLEPRKAGTQRGKPRKTLDPMSRSSPKRHEIKTKNKTVKLKQTNKTMCKRCLRKKNQRISDVIPVPGTSSWFSESVTCLSVSHVINAFIHKSPSLVSCRGRFLTSALR